MARSATASLMMAGVGHAGVFVQELEVLLEQPGQAGIDSLGAGLASDYNPEIPSNDFPTSNIMTGRVSGLTSTFLTSSTIPFNSTTYVPTGGSLGTAVGLTGVAAFEPPIYWLNPSTGERTLRTSLSDLGAVPQLGAPTLVSVTVTDNSGAVPLTVISGATTQAKAIAHWSDSTTTNVTNSSTWSNGGSGAFNINSSTGLITGVAAGSGTATATYLSVPGNATVNVAAPGPARFRAGTTFRSGGTR